MIFLLGALDSDVVRELVKNQVHSYRVHLAYSQGDVKESVNYVISAKCTDDAKDSGQTSVELKFTDYRYQALEHVRRSKLVGAGKLTLGGTGLPNMLKSDVGDTHFWYPMLTWFLPVEAKDGKFDAAQDLGGDTRLNCKGTVKDEDYTMAGDLAGPGSSSATVNLNWKVGKGGWLASGSGDVTDSSGTIHFTISRS